MSLVAELRPRDKQEAGLAAPTVIMLTEAEMELARRLASLRNNPKVEAKTANYRIANRDDWRLHYDGTRAEVACGRVAGFPVDISFDFGGDNMRADIYLGELRGEVKACTYRPPIVKFNALTDFVADVVVVCYVTHPEHREAANVEIWGCISRRKFLRTHEQHDFGHGVRAVVGHELLSPISVLL